MSDDEERKLTPEEFNEFYHHMIKHQIDVERRRNKMPSTITTCPRCGRESLYVSSTGYAYCPVCKYSR